MGGHRLQATGYKAVGPEAGPRGAGFGLRAARHLDCLIVCRAKFAHWARWTHWARLDLGGFDAGTGEGTFKHGCVLRGRGRSACARAWGECTALGGEVGGAGGSATVVSACAGVFEGTAGGWG